MTNSFPTKKLTTTTNTSKQNQVSTSPSFLRGCLRADSAGLANTLRTTIPTRTAAPPPNANNQFPAANRIHVTAAATIPTTPMVKVFTRTCLTDSIRTENGLPTSAVIANYRQLRAQILLTVDDSKPVLEHKCEVPICKPRRRWSDIAEASRRKDQNWRIIFVTNC